MPQANPTGGPYTAQNEARYFFKKTLETGVGVVNSLLCFCACWEGCGSLDGPGKCSPSFGPAVPLLSLAVYGDIMVFSLKGQPWNGKA